MVLSKLREERETRREKKREGEIEERELCVRDICLIPKFHHRAGIYLKTLLAHAVYQ